jgi:hypothetical protein
MIIAWLVSGTFKSLLYVFSVKSKNLPWEHVQGLMNMLLFLVFLSTCTFRGWKHNHLLVQSRDATIKHKSHISLADLCLIWSGCPSIIQVYICHGELINQPSQQWDNAEQAPSGGSSLESKQPTRYRTTLWTVRWDLFEKILLPYSHLHQHLIQQHGVDASKDGRAFLAHALDEQTKMIFNLNIPGTGGFNKRLMWGIEQTQGYRKACSCQFLYAYCQMVQELYMINFLVLWAHQH